MAAVPPAFSNSTLPSGRVAPRSYYGFYGVFFIAAAVVVVVSMVAAAVHAWRRRASALSVLPLYILYISVGSFVSDFTFISSVPREPPLVDGLRTASIVLVLGASVINVGASLAYLVWIVRFGDGAKFDPFKRWLHGHTALVGGLLVSSVTSSRMLSLMHSGLFEYYAFSAPLPVSAIETLDLIGMITTLLEDVPQLCIYIVISTVSATWDSVAFTAVAFSAASVVLTLSCRAVMLRHIVDEERQRGDFYDPRNLKAHKIYRKGSLRSMGYLYGAGLGGADGAPASGADGLLRIESRLPAKLVAALRIVGGGAAAAAGAPLKGGGAGDAGGPGDPGTPPTPLSPGGPALHSN